MCEYLINKMDGFLYSKIVVFDYVAYQGNQQTSTDNSTN